MAGLFAVSMKSKNNEEFLETLFWGTFYLQHLGEEYCGLASFSDENGLKIRTHRGLFEPSFKEDKRGLEGRAGIGYCGSTREPLLIDARLGQIALCFSGNIQNLSQILQELKEEGHILERSDDVEVVAHLLFRGENLVLGLKSLPERLKGSFNLLILADDGTIYAFRSPDGRWPLIIGGNEKMLVVSSESGGFYNLGLRHYFDLKAGELAVIKEGEINTIKKLSTVKPQICSFLWVYTAFPNAVFEGVPASLVRKRLGGFLAEADFRKGFVPDIVAPIPDSGKFHAQGYQQKMVELCLKQGLKTAPLYEEVLLKYPYAGRSFTPSDPSIREERARIKILTSSERFEGATLVVSDDSLVRGTQTRSETVPKLRSMGFRKICLRISFPEIKSHCPWGKTTRREEIFASKIPSLKGKISFLGVDDLRYNDIQALVEAIGINKENLCLDCLF